MRLRHPGSVNTLPQWSPEALDLCSFTPRASTALSYPLTALPTEVVGDPLNNMLPYFVPASQVSLTGLSAYRDLNPEYIVISDA